MIEEILSSISRCAASPHANIDEWIRPYRVADGVPDEHQFLVMLKPELTAALLAQDGAELLAWVMATLAGHGIRLGATRVVSGTHVAQERLVESQYAMLNVISWQGLASVSAAATERLHECYPKFAAAPDRVLGGHQFLHRFPEFSPRSLDVLGQNLPVTKLGAGTYAIEAMLDDEPWLVLNFFHPFQIAHFTTSGSALVLWECTSQERLHNIRSRAIGATDPRRAVPGSIRRELVDPGSRWAGRWSVCASLNAIHVSPSAVEAMFAVQRYFGSSMRRLSLAETMLGARLLAAGVDPGWLQALAADPEVQVLGLQGPLFEITEDIDAHDAAELVLQLSKKESYD